MPQCIVVGNTVTSLCTEDMGQMCNVNAPAMKITGLPASSMSISGTITTTNFIMANWSRQMWQNVVNTAVRMLTADPFASHFATAVAVVN
ncbi:hypothetical protein KIN20_027940 [Parelaphostrongylus tenuis]|uniref:Uncharacterized protein n=1 Tax=Parelaphostrongylus tenuis TaxID=148309 RepID=A0AAD5R0A6_PARTN|nr:hypothetical protein KIN20_027940 [Parelaphostrongylus tenuis]